MQGIQLTFYVHENQRMHKALAWEWLLERARELGIQGGSAFRAIAGFGRHGVLHENHFFELAGDLPVSVSFIVSQEEADRLLSDIDEHGPAVFYTRTPVDYGFVGGPSPR